jgi:glucose/mannose-6-phosphate isomerase
MREIILGFKDQLLWRPEVFNAKKPKNYEKIIVCGMGGSNLAARILKTIIPEIYLHQDYGLPQLNKKELKNSLIICNSYSGNTEETISSFNEAHKLKLNLFVIASGGILLSLAKKYNISYIEIKEKNIPPRLSLGFQIIALLKALNKNNLIKEIYNVAPKINLNALEKQGKILANEFKNYIPLIYSSRQNEALAYNWKIKFNETSKIPAFYNFFPELNHNEMQGFDTNNFTNILVKNFYVLMFYDKNDTKALQKRMALTQKIYQSKKIKTKILKLDQKNIWLKIFNNLILGDWTSFYLAKIYKNSPSEVLLIEKFKNQLKKN